MTPATNSRAVAGAGSAKRTIGLGLFTGQRPTGASGPPYRDAVDLAQAAEDAGFDAFWVSEHHGMPDGYLPAPLMLLAAVATHTNHLVLGTGLALAPLHHPLRLAEDAAVVTTLSEGRLVLGLGLGYAAHEYSAFGVDLACRGRHLSDLVPFLRRAWSGNRFDWDGPAYAGRGLQVTPAAGDIPIWLGGYANPAIRRAREVADGYLIGRSDDVILDEVLPQWNAPVQRPFTIGVNALVVLTDDLDDADNARAGFAFTQRSYEAMQDGGIAHSGLVSRSSPGPLRAETVDPYLQVAGDADTVVAALLALFDRLPSWADHHLVVRAIFPEQDLAGQLARVARLGRDVLPRLR